MALADLSRERFEMALRVAGMGTWRWEIPTGLVDWDGPMEELFGFAPGTFPGTFEAWAQRLHPDDRPGIEDRVANLVRTRGRQQTVEHRIIRADGQLRWISSTSQLRLNEAGEPVELIGVAVDVTDRHAAEEARARLRRERDRAAAILQSSLQPPDLPSVPGVELAAYYRPWTHGLDVSGDFYDAFRVGGRWWLLLGDVCGKGPAAAAVASSVRYAVRALVLDDDDPSRVLRRLNDVLRSGESDDVFTTCVLASLTPAEGGGVRLRLAGGGHPAPLVRRLDGAVASVDLGGTLLGLLPGVEIDESVITLRPGDAMLLYTDGVVEARDAAGEELGEAVVRCLMGTAPATARGLVDAVAEGVAQRATSVRDDLALLALAVPFARP